MIHLHDTAESCLSSRAAYDTTPGRHMVDAMQSRPFSAIPRPQQKASRNPSPEPTGNKKQITQPKQKNPGTVAGVQGGGSGIRTHGGITSTVFKTVQGVLAEATARRRFSRKPLWHNGFGLLVIVHHLPVVCIVFRSPAPPARPQMRRTDHRDAGVMARDLSIEYGHGQRRDIKLS